MAWNTLRKAYRDDYEILNKKAQEFAARHNILIQKNPDPQDRMPYVSDVEEHIWELIENYDDRSMGRYLLRLWHRVVERAFDCPRAEGIAWGMVGYNE